MARQKAFAPLEGTWWKRVGEMLLQAGRDLFNDNAPGWAAAVAYYALLSTFPLLLASASLLSFLVEPSWAVHQAVGVLGKLLPTGEEQIEAVVQNTLARRGTTGLLSSLALLWSGTRIFGTLTQALNIAYDVDEIYGFWKRRLVELLMLLSLGVVFALALIAPFLLALADRVLGVLQVGNAPLHWLMTEAAPAALLLLAFFLLYRFASRRRPRWQAALPGAVLATLLFLASRVLFLEYVRRFANYDLIYGPIAIVFVLVLWVWVAALVLLYGGEVVTHTEEMLIEGRPAAELEQRHRARAPDRRTGSSSGGHASGPPRHE